MLYMMPSKIAIVVSILMCRNILFIQTSVMSLSKSNDTYYDYNPLLSDYNSRDVIDISNITNEKSAHMEPKETSFKEFLNKITYNIKNEKCTDEDMNHINLKSVVCLVKNITNPKHPAYVIFKRMRGVIQIWLLIYVLAAIPLWFTRGWCCCCCFCKFFKPNKTVQEARKYLALNPPGVLIDQRGRVIYYEPTMYERECYERFGHLLRTIY